MGFKVDTSFLRFLTMGALGVRQVAQDLANRGFEPIELERYCGSNKIWATKVKRLRLPDLLCIRTGIRAEVRAKSDLKIRMSDAPNNPDRVWDAEQRDEDIVALIACRNGNDGPEPANEAIYFTVKALRDSVDMSKLGPPKSPSEGAEQDRTWPATVPSRPGRVLSVTDEKLVVMMEGDGNDARRQTYTLNGKHPYVTPGDKFKADVSMLAGAPAALADLNAHLIDEYDPLADTGSDNPVDRYAAVKALRFRQDLRKDSLPALEGMLDTEGEIRVALEAAGSAAFIGSGKAEQFIEDVLWNHQAREMSMEAILILTELKTAFAREQLRRVAGDAQFQGDERRQAAIWGLGKLGVTAYADLLPFISDDEENVAFHAIAAFGDDAPADVIDRLIAILVEGDPKRAPAASEALRVIGAPLVVERLAHAADAGDGNVDWVLATIGRMPPDLVRRQLEGSALLERLQPMLLIAQGANWLAAEEATTNLAFLRKQNL
ncbi:hypothetical protein AY600_17930 [Phormidium willei BDU 130791]|nr:hypothetical protein AY600_17930 [Phormidium willei BDU 130791]